MKKNFIYTLCVNILVILSGLLVYKLALFFFDIRGFTEYSLARRIIAFLYPIFLLGLSVGITRYVSYFLKDKNRMRTVMAGGIVLLLISNLLILLVSKFLKGEIAKIFFGSPEYVSLVFPMFLTVSGLLWYALAYSYYRGKLEFGKASLLQLVNLSFIPVIVFFVSNDVAHLFLYNGILVLANSLLITAYIIFDEKLYRVAFDSFFLQEMKRLFFYSVGRVIGDIGLAALFLLVPIFVTHLSSVREGGFVAFGISLLNLTASFFVSIGIVVLPRVGVLYASKHYKILLRDIYMTLLVSSFLSCFIVIVFYILGQKILKLYLGRDVLHQLWVFKMIILGLIPYVIYVSLRSFIDAVYEKPYNAINILITLVIMVLFSLFIYIFRINYICILYIFLFSLWVLAGLTLFRILKIMQLLMR